MIIAIDGPAGSGKSTVARALAAREHLTYLDTGAMYRAVTCAALERGVDINNPDALAALARTINIDLVPNEGGPTVRIDGVDRTREIRTPQVDACVSTVAAVPAVREAMVEQQRRIAGNGDVVAEGRDVGSVVFPRAEVKIFLSAHPSTRAHRRVAQRAGDGAARGSASCDAASERLVEAELVARDKADTTRAASPLRPASDAVHIDSTDLTVDEVCDRISALMRRARS